MTDIAIKTKTTAKIKTLSISAKCSDCCVAALIDENGAEVFENDGYVPDFMPGEHFGDYVMLDIDLETGQIKNWTPPTAEQIEEWIEANTR